MGERAGDSQPQNELHSAARPVAARGVKGGARATLVQRGVRIGPGVSSLDF